MRARIYPKDMGMANRSERDNDGERRKRIDDLKRQADELTGGEMTSWESEDCPDEISEEFWRNVVAYEQAPRTTHFKQLEEAGVALPAPETMDDPELRAKLWEVIYKLASTRVFFEQTNHLGDRELYTALWTKVLREETMDFSFGDNSAWRIDLLGSYGVEETCLYMKYYAKEERRREWLADFPDYEMPAHEDPPYDRDDDLPQGFLTELFEQSDEERDEPGSLN